MSDYLNAIAETGECSRDFNRTEFVAKALAREDGKRWDQLPNVSTLWFKDKLHYRVMAGRAISSLRLWDMYRFTEDIRATPNQTGEVDRTCGHGCNSGSCATRSHLASSTCGGCILAR